MKRKSFCLTALLVTSITSTYLHSADGVLEVNQACALNGGCFSGDTAGFPVTIDGSAGKSYRLTGDLDLSAHPTDPAISISESFVTLDLNGFQIAGATECVPEPVIGSELICTPINSGAHGIELVGQVRSVSIKNGTIRKMPDDGISGASTQRTHVENMTLSENAGWGALLGDRSLIQSSDAEMNGGGGFSVQDDSNISRSQANGNDGNGFEAGDRAIVSFCSGEEAYVDNRAFVLGPSSKFKSNTVRGSARCGGGICAEQRRYYLSQSTVLPNETTTACGNGFRMASLWELRETSSLKYDSVLGYTTDNAGGGPPNDSDAVGWIRDGNDHPDASCNLWSSTSDTFTGIAVRLITVGVGESASPWRPFILPCDRTFLHIWCVEN